MANAKGIDVIQTGVAAVREFSLKDSSGAKVTTGTATYRVFEVQDDGTLKSFDFNDHTFKTTALTTATKAVTHRTGDNGTYNTGVWSVVLSTTDLAGFNAGRFYVEQCSNTGASPPDQERRFHYGSADVDVFGTAGLARVGVLQVDVINILGTTSVGTAGYVGIDWAWVTGKTTANALTGTTISATQTVNVTKWGGVNVPALPDNFNLLTISALGYVSANVVQAAGVTVYAKDGTLASATSSTITFNTLDAAGNSTPDMSWHAIRTNGGTGGNGRTFHLTTNVSGQTYNCLENASALDGTTTYLDLGPWTAAVTHIGGGASVGAAGYVGVDWGQVANKTTANALTGTSISTSQVVASVSGAVGSVTGPVGSVTGNVGGNVTGSVGSVTGNVGGSVVGSTASVLGTVGGMTAAGWATAFTVNSTKTYANAVDGSVVKEIVANVSGGGGGGGSWTSVLTESYAADGAEFTPAQALYMIYSAIMEASLSGVTMSFKKLDGTVWGTVK